MFDQFNLFVSKAMAADVAAPAIDAAAASPDAMTTLMRFAPWALIFMVFYFLLIRPQQKKMDAQIAMHKALKKGDKVITSGGIVGAISKVDGDEYVVVEIAKGVDVKVLKSTISAMADDAKPANENKN